MKTLREDFQAWRERRRQNNLECWERKRTKGKLRYVLGFMTVWCGVMIIGVSLSDYFFNGYVSTGKLWFNAFYFLITGFILGLRGWSANERKYYTQKSTMDMNHQVK